MTDRYLVDKYEGERSEAVRQVTKYLLTPQGRDLMRLNKYYEGEKHLVPAYHEEPISAVLQRAQRYERPIVLAVYFPDRQGPSRFSLVELRELEDIEGNKLGEITAHVNASIGLFVDSLDRDKPSRFEFQWGHSLARPFAAV